MPAAATVWRRLASALLAAAFGVGPAAAGGTDITTFEHVEYLVSDAPEPPGDAAPWQPTTLPDNWAMTRPGFKGQVWYRMRFHIAEHGPRSRAVYIPRNNASHYVIFFNGMKRGGNRAYTDPNLTDLHRPLIHGTAGLPVGENIMYVRVSGDARYRHGLSRIVIGPPRLLRPQYFEPRYDLQVTSITAFGTTLFLAGLLALVVWRGERRDPVLLWFGIVALTWALCTFLMVWPPQVESEAARQLLLYGARHLFAVPLLVLCLRAGGVRHRWLEGALWSLLAAGLAGAAALDAERYAWLAMVSWALFLTLSLGVFGWLLWRRWHARAGTAYLPGLTLVVVMGLTAHDWARWTGYADYDNLLLAPFAMPFLILALGATVIDRYLQSARALARSNVELEQRVAEKAQQLEQAYERMQATEREQAVLRERQRIMGDMHDGLSANLVSLHNMVQSENADSAEVARRLDETLRELRAIVDSLEPVEGDLGVVLGNIRYRMRAAIEESGAKLRWQVAPLPVLPDLTPEKILNIQRVVLEALTNALRHAVARTITVAARAAVDRDAIVIAIADDGTGFDLAASGAGRGLRSMRERAARIGVALDIDSQPGQGTTVTLEIPITRG